jgi:hypothetical protein
LLLPYNPEKMARAFMQTIEFLSSEIDRLERRVKEIGGNILNDKYTIYCILYEKMIKFLEGLDVSCGY